MRDAGGSICLKVENGCLRPTELTNAMGAALPSTKIDPFNRFIRRPAGRSVGTLEIEILNSSDRPASLDFLEVLVNNTGSVFDVGVPFVPNGIAASLIGPSFVPGQTLAPNDSITFSFSGSFDDALAISAETGGMIDGVYLRGLTGTVVPEPATFAMLLLGLVGAAVRRARA